MRSIPVSELKGNEILAKDIQVNLPPQTRGDLDMIMSGGMI